jgi:hypothetical protein
LPPTREAAELAREPGSVKRVFEPLGHRSLSVDLSPIAIVIVALQSLRPELEPLPHDEQKPLERLHRRRDLISLKP